MPARSRLSICAMLLNALASLAAADTAGADEAGEVVRLVSSGTRLRTTGVHGGSGSGPATCQWVAGVLS